MEIKGQNGNERMRRKEYGRWEYEAGEKCGIGGMND